MKAKLTKLYTEHKCGTDWIGDYPADEVIVKLRRWSGGGCHDFILEKTVTVDGSVEVDSVVVLERSTQHDNKAIRHAIQVFDDLVAAHPTLGKEKEQME